MRFHRVQLFLGCTAFIALAAAAYSCGVYGSGETLAAGTKVPANIHRSVIRGNLLVALLADNRLVSVDLTTGVTRTLATIEGAATILDVVNNKACVSSKNRVMIVDLADGKTTHAGACDFAVGALGFLSPDRVFVQGGPQIKVFDLATGKTIHDVSLGKADAQAASLGYRTLGRSGKQLFVSVAREKDAVAVFDLEQGEVTDRYSAAELHNRSNLGYQTNLHFAGDTAYVLSSRFAYGVWVESFGVVDLKTRKYTAIKLPEKSMQQPSLIPGPRGTVFLASPNGTFQFDATGKMTATIVSPKETHRLDGTMLGMWQGKALFVDRQELRQLPMPAATAQAK